MSRTTITDDFDIDATKPIGNRVLVEILEREETKGGLWIASSGTPVVLGRVLAMGRGVEDRTSLRVWPFGFDVGDIILFMEYGGEGGRIENREGKFRMLPSDSIWAKVAVKNENSHEIDDIEPRIEFLVVRPETNTESEGGIVYPRGENTEAQWRMAEVVKVGPGPWMQGTDHTMPLDLEPGERIIMTRYAGAEITVGGEELRIIQVTDVIAACEED